ncbi:MAG: DNA polymerase beta superfamily protein [Pseudomarimonas sp.]
MHKLPLCVAQDSPKLKKVFYVLRPLLACRWMHETGTQSPTEFARLVAADWMTTSEHDMIAALTLAQADASESFRSSLNPATRQWFEQELAAADSAFKSIRSSASLEISALDDLLRGIVARPGS